MMYCKGGGLFDKASGMLSGLIAGVGSTIKKLGITGISTPYGSVGIEPSGIPTPPLTAGGVSPVGITMQPQLPIKMILIGGGAVVGLLILMMFLKR